MTKGHMVSANGNAPEKCSLAKMGFGRKRRAKEAKLAPGGGLEGKRSTKVKRR